VTEKKKFYPINTCWQCYNIFFIIHPQPNKLEGLLLP
jgi:hypothetical protein